MSGQIEWDVVMPADDDPHAWVAAALVADDRHARHVHDRMIVDITQVPGVVFSVAKHRPFLSRRRSVGIYVVGKGSAVKTVLQIMRNHLDSIT